MHTNIRQICCSAASLRDLGGWRSLRGLLDNHANDHTYQEWANGATGDILAGLFNGQVKNIPMKKIIMVVGKIYPSRRMAQSSRFCLGKIAKIAK